LTGHAAFSLPPLEEQQLHDQAQGSESGDGDFLANKRFAGARDKLVIFYV